MQTDPGGSKEVFEGEYSWLCILATVLKNNMTLII